MKTPIFEFQSTICKTFGSPQRLQIMNLLKSGELSATEITIALGVSKANASQHLAVMRMKGLLKTRRDGIHIYYRIANGKLAQACSLMQEALLQIQENENETTNEETLSKKEDFVLV